MNTNRRIRTTATQAAFLALVAWNAMGQGATDPQALIEKLPHLPDGHALAAYVDCGGAEPPDAGKVRRFTLLQGAPVAVPDGSGSLSSAVMHENAVTYRLDGLDPDTDYVLGLTWWDFDDAGRRQSLQIGTGNPTAWSTLLPAGRPLAFHRGKPTWAHVLLPLERSRVSGGQVIVAVTNEGGTNAVVSDLWVLAKIAKDERKRVLIVTGDEYEGHAWRETAAEFATILRGDPRLEVTISETPRVLASPVLDHYDAVFLHFKDYPDQLPTGEAEWNGVERFIASGRGFVMAHFAIGAFQEWPGFADVVGRVWNPEMRGHDPYGPFEVLVSHGDHPVVAGMADYPTVGELYTCLDGAAEIDVLCEACSSVDGKRYPMAFVVPGSAGRVFQCTMGHDVKALRSEGTRELYRRATAWAAGLPPRE